jgi:hypothetical protein
VRQALGYEVVRRDLRVVVQNSQIEVQKGPLKSESVQHNEFDIERAESGVHVPRDHAARTPQEGQQYATRNVDLIWVRTGQADEAILGLKLC